MTDIWKHGKFVDMWSVVHLSSGFLLSGFLYWMGYSFELSLILAVAALVAWEGFEWLTRIIEPSVNVFVDIIIGMVGFLVGAYLYFGGARSFDPVDFWIVLAVTLVLSLWGFLDFKKRGYR